MVKFWQVSLGIGSLILLGALLIFCIGAGYLWGAGVEDYTEEENRDAGIDMMICGPFILVPGLVFFIIGTIGLLRRRRNGKYAAFLKANRRIRIEDFASKMGTTEFRAEDIILEVLEEKLIEGYIDRRTGEFFTKEYIEQTPNVRFGWKCRSCGAKNETMVLPGETVKCEYCGSFMDGNAGRV